MHFTALHRLLGYQPGPITDEMIDAAVGLGKTADLDWKSELPGTNGLTKSDFPKAIAAMANNGGGIIVYGIKVDQRRATGRCDVGELTENHERTIRSAAVTAITPSVFGLDIVRIGGASNQVVAIIVGPSVDTPHLIYRNKQFGAPIRNDADTVWMNERQLELMYRARFDERRHANDALDHLYDEQSAGRDTDQCAWLIAVARPRIPAAGQTRPTREDAEMFDDANRHGFTTTGISPRSVSRQNPRPGLRRWIAPNSADNDHTRWRETWASIHHNGSVALAAAIGGQRATGTVLAVDQVDSAAVEHAVADLMALIRSAGKRFGTNEYEARVGIEWAGRTPLIIQTADEENEPDTRGSPPVPVQPRHHHRPRPHRRRRLPPADPRTRRRLHQSGRNHHTARHPRSRTDAVENLFLHHNHDS